MIYAVEKKEYPKIPIEEFYYRDENDFEWKIGRLESCFYVLYCGDGYFMDSTFETTHNRIKNTGCILFKDGGFDSFYDVRTIIENGFTDDIWDCFSDLFEERFLHSEFLLESEKL